MSDLYRLTVVVADKAVYKNAEGYSDLDFSDCGIPEDVWAFQWENGEGWIEFKGLRENEKVVGANFPEWANKCVQKFDEFDVIYKTPPPPPTPEQWAATNDNKAKFLLEESDWAALPDTNLQNQTEWNAYRSSLRSIMLNPPQEEMPTDSWPVKPEVVWA